MQQPSTEATHHSSGWTTTNGGGQVKKGHASRSVSPRKAQALRLYRDHISSQANIPLWLSGSSSFPLPPPDRSIDLAATTKQCKEPMQVMKTALPPPPTLPVMLLAV
jgi:hypothetical protein